MSHSSRDPEQVRTDEGFESDFAPVPAGTMSSEEQLVVADTDLEKARKLRDRRFAQAMGENSEWLRAHEKEILKEHPDWDGKYVLVCLRTPSKILAVSEDRDAAIDEGLLSPELVELARREGVLPGDLPTAMLLGGAWIY